MGKMTDSTHEGEIHIFWAVLIMFFLFGGEPDMYDALMHFLMAG